MENVKLMGLKFIVSLAILYMILGVGFDVSFGNVFLITLVLGIVSYVLGDKIILARSNNITATIADAVLAFVVIYMMTDALTVGNTVFEATLISTISLAIFEYFFHQSVARTLKDVDEQKRDVEQKNTTGQLSMEASEELTPDDPRNKEER
ncbi:YndM family protein [Halobacillus sp. B23F22_1]|uniref:YndM family protein n=1 Tax=Halobacillus sp. B23F22_1 TaxID=3459514 RepID=UPI00373F0F01